jgi:hypothetical protein
MAVVAAERVREEVAFFVPEFGAYIQAEDGIARRASREDRQQGIFT